MPGPRARARLAAALVRALGQSRQHRSARRRPSRRIMSGRGPPSDGVIMPSSSVNRDLGPNVRRTSRNRRSRRARAPSESRGPSLSPGGRHLAERCRTKGCATFPGAVRSIWRRGVVRRVCVYHDDVGHGCVQPAAGSCEAASERRGDRRHRNLARIGSGAAAASLAGLCARFDALVEPEHVSAAIRGSRYAWSSAVTVWSILTYFASAAGGRRPWRKWSRMSSRIGIGISHLRQLT